MTQTWIRENDQWIVAALCAVAIAWMTWRLWVLDRRDRDRDERAVVAEADRIVAAERARVVRETFEGFLWDDDSRPPRR